MTIQKLSVEQLKTARALLGWSQEDLAAASDVSLPTIKMVEEEGDGVLGGRSDSGDKIINALEAAGIVLSPDDEVARSEVFCA